jgi:hypothetical protein
MPDPSLVREGLLGPRQMHIRWVRADLCFLMNVGRITRRPRD